MGISGLDPSGHVWLQIRCIHKYLYGGCGLTIKTCVLLMVVASEDAREDADA